MKTLYFDCGMGAAGDMLTAALSELLPDPDKFVEKLNLLKIPNVEFRREKAVKCGIVGTHISVLVHGGEEGAGDRRHGGLTDEREHRHGGGMREIEHTVAKLEIPEKVKNDVLSVYGLIAEAESRVHGVPVAEIHFHELGTADAVADITAVCLLINEIAPDEIVSSPVNVGGGHVECAHGGLPVPAPATAHILRGVPVYGGGNEGELCTPTGAALLKRFSNRFGDMPVMKIDAVGYGMGKKDFPAANCVRAVIGETSGGTDTVSELSCNVDDMTAEEIAFATEIFFEGGAKEVYTVPAGMKKSRSGTVIRVVCEKSDRDKMVRLIFKYTSTIGVREAVMRRYVLDRRVETEASPYGDIRRKMSSGYGVSREKYEYDDLARIARERSVSIDEVKRLLKSGK